MSADKAVVVGHEVAEELMQPALENVFHARGL